MTWRTAGPDRVAAARLPLPRPARHRRARHPRTGRLRARYACEHAKLDRLRQLAEDGRITMRAARTLPAEQAAEAHRLAASGIRGGVVLTF